MARRSAEALVGRQGDPPVCRVHPVRFVPVPGGRRVRQVRHDTASCASARCTAAATDAALPLKTYLLSGARRGAAEKEVEHKLLKGHGGNQWMLHDEEFRHQRDVYKSRANRDADEMVWYWAWG